MRRWKTIAIEVAVVIAVVLLLRVWVARDLIHGPAPDFEGMLIDGNRVVLSEYADGPMLLHFWSSWCTICKLEEGGITRISRSHPVLTVAMRSGTPEDILAHLNERERSLPVVNDPDGKLSEMYGVRAVPSTFIIDRNGKIVFRKQGYAPPFELRLRLRLAALR